MKFDYEIEPCEALMIVRLKGHLLQSHDGDALLEEVADLVQEGKVWLVLDMRLLEYINSSGLSVLIRILTKTRKAGGECLIMHLNERLQKLFIITKLDTLFYIGKSMLEVQDRLNQMPGFLSAGKP